MSEYEKENLYLRYLIEQLSLPMEEKIESKYLSKEEFYSLIENANT